MKRRNAEIGKMRRPVKRNKIAEGIYGSSTFLYLKFLIIWVLVILADFILEFRFEFLWPFYLLLRSVYDSFKYQGLAFSIFFVCIALTSDMLCFFFIPVHWLFFAASTYVWVQYVWHTDRGICAPTIILWMLFVYLEAAVRLRDVKHMPGHLDLCRPFAAHCIGYPVVTLGFGFKSYVGYRMRQRRQRDVAKENEFYMQLMQQALPLTYQPQAPIEPSPAILPAAVGAAKEAKVRAGERNGHIPNCNAGGVVAMNGGLVSTRSHRRSVDKCKDLTNDGIGQKVGFSHSHTNGVGAGDEVVLVQGSETVAIGHETQRTNRRREKKEQDKEREAAEYLLKLETDTKRLRSELQTSRMSEQDLRLQVASFTTSEKVSKGEISTMQREIEDLQQRLQNVQNARSSDKQTIGNLERRIQDERRTRNSLETQLNQERKSRKQEEARIAQVVARSAECTEACRQRRRDLETDLSESRTSKRWADERYAALERESATIVDQLREKELVLTAALSQYQDANAHLENSLSAETRIKLDLFSALGEAKRQLELRETSNRTQEREIEALKGKIAQVLAVMPSDAFDGQTSGVSRVRLADKAGSTLDPNATVYTPKNSMVASTEA